MLMPSSQSPRRWFSCVVALALSTLVLTGLARPLVAQQAAPKPSSSKSPAPANHISERKLLEEASAISRQVGAFRGLGLKAEIAKGLKNRDQLRVVLLERLAEEVSDEEVENEAHVYKKLELMPADLDYKQTLLNVLTEQIAGFYDQHAKELYIMEGIPLELQRPAMAHEIFHAIQDQHFDILRMIEPVSNRDNGDFALARSALIEGDASLVMIDFSLYERGVLPQGRFQSVVDIPMMAQVLEQITRKDIGALQQLMPDGGGDDLPVDPNTLAETALGEAPRMIRKLLIFPYFSGMRFIIHARTGHDWGRVNQIYTRPPVSTEQILHPERYFAGDEPTLLQFSTDGILTDDERIYESVLGEYQMRLFLEQHLLDAQEQDADAARVVDQAMLGWGGDRLRAFRTADAQVRIAHLSVWDTLRDADEYFDALTLVMKKRFPDATVQTHQGKFGRSICLVVTHPDGAERIYVEQWGDLVLQLEGLPTVLNAQGEETDPTTYQLRDEIMHSVERTPFDKHYRAQMKAWDAEHSAGNEADAPAPMIQIAD